MQVVDVIWIVFWYGIVLLLLVGLITVPVATLIVARKYAQSLLAGGIYALISGPVYVLLATVYERIPLSRDGQAFMLPYLVGLWFTLMGGLVIVAGSTKLAGLRRPWVFALFLLPVLLTGALAQLLPRSDYFMPQTLLLYSVTSSLVCLGLLVRARQHWPVLVRALVIGAGGAALGAAYLVVRGAGAWIVSPLGMDCILVSVLLGIGILLAGNRFVPFAQPTQQAEAR